MVWIVGVDGKSGRWSRRWFGKLGWKVKWKDGV